MVRVRSTTCFTLAEVLVAMVFVAIVLPVAVHAALIANRAGVVARHKRVAVRLADGLLTEVAATDDWEEGEEEGDFGEDWPAYRWRLTTDDWADDQETMRLLRLEVSFEVQGHGHFVELYTLVPTEEVTSADEQEAEPEP